MLEFVQLVNNVPSILDAAEKAMEKHLKSAFEGMEIQVFPDDYIAL